LIHKVSMRLNNKVVIYSYQINNGCNALLINCHVIDFIFVRVENEPTYIICGGVMIDVFGMLHQLDTTMSRVNLNVDKLGVS